MLTAVLFALSYAALVTSHPVDASLEEEIFGAGSNDSFPASLARREGYQFQFVGFHGTTKLNVDFYMKGPHIGVPPLFNGNDAELAPGMYMTDDITTAVSFAQTAANRLAHSISRKDEAVKGVRIEDAKPYVCAVEPSEPWSSIPKVWIPLIMLAKNTNGENDPNVLQRQENLIKSHHSEVDKTVRFSLLDEKLEDKTDEIKSLLSSPSLDLAVKGALSVHAQALIPPKALQSQFRIRHCGIVLDEAAPKYQSLLWTLSTKGYPDFSYFGQRRQWGILGEPV